MPHCEQRAVLVLELDLTSAQLVVRARPQVGGCRVRQPVTGAEKLDTSFQMRTVAVAVVGGLTSTSLIQAVVEGLILSEAR